MSEKFSGLVCLVAVLCVCVAAPAHKTFVPCFYLQRTIPTTTLSLCPLQLPTSNSFLFFVSPLRPDGIPDERTNVRRDTHGG